MGRNVTKTTGFLVARFRTLFFTTEPIFQARQGEGKAPLDGRFFFSII